MRAVLKKEFNSLFARLYGYITVSLISLVAVILFIFYNLTLTAENTLNVISAMSVATALVIPVLAIALYPNAKRSDTDAVYACLPLRSRDVVIGKYLAALAVLMLPNILLAVFPAFAGMYGLVDHTVSYAALLGLIFFQAALLAVCTYIAKTARGRISAYIKCYVTVVVWYLSAIVSVLIPLSPVASLVCFAIVAVLFAVLLYFVMKSLPISIGVGVGMGAVIALTYTAWGERYAGLFESLLDSFSIFEQLNRFVYGLFNVEGIIYFAALILLFMYLTCRELDKKTKAPRLFKGLTLKSTLSVLTAVILSAAMLAVGCAAYVIPDRYMFFDSTLSGKNSASDKAVDYLSSIDKEVDIYLLEPTGNKDYEVYLEKLTACNKNIMLTKVYNKNTPEFYTERGITAQDITANSVVIETDARKTYLSYLDLFHYSNTTLGASEMTASQYSYYYTMFSSNSQYASYLQSLLYDTVMYFDGDARICECIEYVTADVIPTIYGLSGHGEADMSSASSPYASIGMSSLEISDADIPADASAILINMPTGDISESEKDKLLDYLENGGQLTFITNEANLYMPNLCSILAEYGLTAQKGIVSEKNEEEETVTEFSPVVDTANDILYYLDSVSNLAPTVKDANAITVTAKDNVTAYPLISTSDKAFIGESSENTASYIIACAADTADAKIVWFTGGESFNDITNDASSAVLCALDWVTLRYESGIKDFPAVPYSQPIAEVNAGLLKVLLVCLPLGICVFGVISFYKRKKA